MEVNKGRRSYNKRPYTIVVEGNIGSGKTTFLQPFTTLKQVVFVVVASTRALCTSGKLHPYNNRLR